MVAQQAQLSADIVALDTRQMLALRLQQARHRQRIGVIGLILGASTLAILCRAMGHDLVDGGLATAEQELGEALAQRATILDPPNAIGVAFACPVERRIPTSWSIRDTVGAVELPACIESNEDMPFLMGIHTDVHAALPCLRLDRRHAGATCLYGEGHTLPSSLPPGAKEKEATARMQASRR